LKRRIPTLLFTLALIATTTFIHWRRNEVMDSFSMGQTVSFDKASLAVFAAGDAQRPDSYFIVYDSNKRVAQVDADGALLQLLKSKSNAKAGFYLANDVAVAGDGTIYIASTYINPETLAVNRECIVKYDRQGRYGGVVFTHDHDESEVVDNTGLIRGLQSTADGVRFCMLSTNAILTYQVSSSAAPPAPPVRTEVPDARVAVQSATLSSDGMRLAFTTAAARLFVCRVGETPQLAFDGSATDRLSIPGHVRFLGDAIYFSDLGGDNIAQLQDGNQSQVVFDAEAARRAGYDDRFYECKNFQAVTADRMVFNNNGKIIDFDRAGNTCRILNEARWSVLIWLIRGAYWLVLLVAACSAILLLRRVALSADEDGRRMFKQMLLVVCMVVAAAGIAVSMVFSNMSRQLNESSMDGLRGYLELGRLLVDADAVDRVRHVSHYMNDDYSQLLRQLQLIITRDGALQAGTYSGIYKVFGNKVTALAYHDGLRGIFFPYDYDYEASIYAPVQRDGKIYMGEIADQYGVWQIGVAPIHNANGDCVGILEVGLDMSARQEANRQLLKKTVISIAMVLFVLIFIFLELGFLNTHVFVNVAANDVHGKQMYAEGVLRFASYLALTGVFLSAAFLPLFSKALSYPMGNLPIDIVIGLPLVVETLCGAVVAVAYGHIHHRLGIKFDIIVACLVTAAGMVLTGMADSYAWLTAGRVVVGMGIGLLMIAFRTYFLIDGNSAYRESGVVALTAGVVAGINTGAVAGGMLAARLGMRNVFMMQAVLLVLAAVFVLLMLRNRRRLPSVEGPQALSTWKFVFSRDIWVFFCFSFLPVTACGMFLGFFFPLFAEAQGCTEEEISGAFMLFGLCGVYLGPSLTRMTTDAFGAGRAVFVGAIIMTAGLLFFAYAQTLTAAYITVLLFGLTDSFIFNQGLNYLTSLKQMARFGEDKTMGVYNVFESGGEAVGPIVFGLAMSFGLMTGVGLIAGMLALTSTLFLVISKPTKEPPC